MLSLAGEFRVSMADAKPQTAAGSNLLFLREEEIRVAQDLLFFAYRDFTNAADVILEELGLGRAHHRALHFIGRNPGIAVTDLLAILRITKQSLARVLGALVAQGYVAQTQGRADRRQRLLALTPAGQALERRLFERQRERLVAGLPRCRGAGGGGVPASDARHYGRIRTRLYGGCRRWPVDAGRPASGRDGQSRTGGHGGGGLAG